MSRPTDWTPLQHYDDPIPGDPFVVQSAADDYSQIAEAIGRASSSLTGLVGGSGMVSEAVSAFSEQAEQVGERIGRAQDRYAGVARALSDYVSPLATAQSWSADALADASGAHSVAMSAEDDMARFMYQLGDVSLDEAERARYERLIEDAVQVRTGADSIMANAVELLQRAIDLRNSAATAAADSISMVENSGDLNDEFWDNVDQFFEENKHWIDGVLFVAGIIAGLLVLVAMFVPGLNLIVGAIVAIVAIATVLNGVGQALTGNKSWTEAIVEIALALVPLGAGRLIGAGMKTVHAATRTAAATSVMRSAAGQAISGVTRTVALRQVDDVAATVTSRILSGTDLRVVAETAAMANMRLTGGGMSRHVLNAALPMAAFGGAWILNGPVVPFIEAGLKEGTKGWRDATTGTIRNEDW